MVKRILAALGRLLWSLLEKPGRDAAAAESARVLAEARERDAEARRRVDAMQEEIRLLANVERDRARRDPNAAFEGEEEKRS